MGDRTLHSANKIGTSFWFRDLVSLKDMIDIACRYLTDSFTKAIQVYNSLLILGGDRDVVCSASSRPKRASLDQPKQDSYRVREPRNLLCVGLAYQYNLPLKKGCSCQGLS